MTWDEIRTAYPDQWLIVEAMVAHTDKHQKRLLDKIAVIETCSDNAAALQRYRALHRLHPQREFYFVHTSRQELNIHEIMWPNRHIDRLEMQFDDIPHPR